MILISLTGFSQRKIKLTSFSNRSEIGVFFGGSYYLGELNQFKPFYRTKPAFGIVYRKNFNPRIAFKLNGLYGNIEGFDSDSPDKYQQNRNLSFKSRLIELSGQVEFNFLPYTIGDPETPFSPYLFTGLSVFYFKPQGQLNGQWIDLQDYSTEGQGVLPGKKNYASTQVSMPFGGGVKINLTNRFGLAIEWGLRKTFTDYLDDISSIYVQPEILKIANGTNAVTLSDPNSQNNEQTVDMTGYQRGNTKRKDLYSFAGIILTYRFGNDNNCYFKSK